ncbi:hypothetical protein, partial [Streptomyces sp. NPDC001948]
QVRTNDAFLAAKSKCSLRAQTWLQWAPSVNEWNHHADDEAHCLVATPAGQPGDRCRFVGGCSSSFCQWVGGVSGLVVWGAGF